MLERSGGFGRRTSSVGATQTGPQGFGTISASGGFGTAPTERFEHSRVNGSASDIDFKIIGNDLQFVEIELDPGESVIGEPGAMVWKDFDIEPATMLDANADPDVGLGRRMLNAGQRMVSGENLFLAVFTNQGVGISKRAKIAFSSPMPGNILPLRLSDYGGKVICQRESFLAAARGVTVGATLIPGMRGRGVSGMLRGGITGMLGGEGFIMQKMEGEGWAFVHMGGVVIERKLEAGERIHVDTGCVAAFTQGVDMCVVMAGGGIRNRALGGEGLFYAALTGPGTVWIQSMPFARLAVHMVHAAAGGGYGGETGIGEIAEVAAIGALGIAGVAAVGTGAFASGAIAEQMAENYAKDAFTTATGLDADSGILGTIGGWLSND